MSDITAREKHHTKKRSQDRPAVFLNK